MNAFINVCTCISALARHGALSWRRGSWQYTRYTRFANFHCPCVVLATKDKPALLSHPLSSAPPRSRGVAGWSCHNESVIDPLLLAGVCDASLCRLCVSCERRGSDKFPRELYLLPSRKSFASRLPTHTSCLVSLMMVVALSSSSRSSRLADVATCVISTDCALPVITGLVSCLWVCGRCGEGALVSKLKRDEGAVLSTFCLGVGVPSTTELCLCPPR